MIFSSVFSTILSSFDFIFYSSYIYSPVADNSSQKLLVVVVTTATKPHLVVASQSRGSLLTAYCCDLVRE